MGYQSQPRAQPACCGRVRVGKRYKENMTKPDTNPFGVNPTDRLSDPDNSVYKDPAHPRSPRYIGRFVISAEQKLGIEEHENVEVNQLAREVITRLSRRIEDYAERREEEDSQKVRKQIFDAVVERFSVLYNAMLLFSDKLPVGLTQVIEGAGFSLVGKDWYVYVPEKNQEPTWENIAMLVALEASLAWIMNQQMAKQQANQEFKLQDTLKSWKMPNQQLMPTLLYEAILEAIKPR